MQVAEFPANSENRGTLCGEHLHDGWLTEAVT